MNLRNSLCNPSTVSETHYDWSAGGFGKGRVIPSPLQAAIQTAKIFNGVTVGKDGILLSQNERAETGLLGKTIKEGQSRQAVKIERMLDNTDFGSVHLRDSRQDRPQRNPSSPTPQLLIVRRRIDDFNRVVTKAGKTSTKDVTVLAPSYRLDPSEWLLFHEEYRQSDIRCSPNHA